MACRVFQRLGCDDVIVEYSGVAQIALVKEIAGLQAFTVLAKCYVTNIVLEVSSPRNAHDRNMTFKACDPV